MAEWARAHVIRLYINMWNMIYEEAISTRIDAVHREIIERACMIDRTIRFDPAAIK